MKRGKRDLPRLINCLSDRGSPNLPTYVLLWQCKATKEQSLRNATPTYVRVHDLCVFIGRCRLRGHSFSTYAQISRFQTHPPTVYAQIMTSLWRQYIGVRTALDPPTLPLRCVRTKWMAPSPQTPADQERWLVQQSLSIMTLCLWFQCLKTLVCKGLLVGFIERCRVWSGLGWFILYLKVSVKKHFHWIATQTYVYRTYTDSYCDIEFVFRKNRCIHDCIM